PLRQALAGAQIEGHPRPAPVVHSEPERRVRLGLRVRRDAFLLAIARNLLAADEPRAVLTAERDLVDLARVDRPDGAHHLALLVVHRAGVEGDRGLERDEAQELEQVILHHVAERARLPAAAP